MGSSPKKLWPSSCPDFVHVIAGLSTTSGSQTQDFEVLFAQPPPRAFRPALGGLRARAEDEGRREEDESLEVIFLVDRDGGFVARFLGHDWAVHDLHGVHLGAKPQRVRIQITCQTETEAQTQTQTDANRQRERERDMPIERQTDRVPDRQTDRQRQRQRDTDLVAVELLD
eukprot:3655726-Rhodomonas_salina.2